MQQVGMKKQGITWFHFTIYFFPHFQHFIHSFYISASLVTRQNVVYTPHFMRTPDYLKTAVGGCCPIHGYHYATEVRKKKTILVPISIVLMPSPRSPHSSILQYHF